MIFLSSDAASDIERLRTFLDRTNPDAARRALALIWVAIDRLQEFPAMGMPAKDARIRQIIIRFGASGYIVRYNVMVESKRHSHHAHLAWTRDAHLKLSQTRSRSGMPR
jgi:plasmid stabilization system protein ParE